MRAVLRAGVCREQIEDALSVYFSFNAIDRLADTFELFVPGPSSSTPERSSCSRVAIADPQQVGGFIADLSFHRR
jgi:hypothetical protein